MKIKVSEAKDKVLDYLVAKCEGAENFRFDSVACWWFTLNGVDRVLSSGWSTQQNFNPSSDWAQGGPIIEREYVNITYDDVWTAEDVDGGVQWGGTPLTAAMRCYVASKLGDTVEIPEELA